MNNIKPAKHETLLDATRRLLRDRPRTLLYSKIAKDTGLNERWLESVHSSETRSPRVLEVQALYEYLTGKPLNLS